MSTEILINVTARDTRIALVVDQNVQEIFIERADHLRLIGNIYKGRVVRVLPGMQAAFIDIGLARTAYLHASDIFTTGHQGTHKPLKVDQELLVQVVKDPIDSKGAKVTTRLSITTRNLAYVPSLKKNSISDKIDDAAEAQRLLHSLQKNKPDTQGFVVRTNARGTADLGQDQNYLLELWGHIIAKSKQAKTGDLVYAEPGFIQTTLRDLLTKDVKNILVDDPESLAVVQQYCAQAVPDLSLNIKFYNNVATIVAFNKLQEAITSALLRKVPLKSGGYLVFDYTEAMTVVDVNTGAYVGETSLEHTAFTTNLEAVPVLCRQIKLRNLGGIVVVDFIDMSDESHREQVLTLLAQELSKDRVKTTCSGFSSLGLVEITRKRVQQSLHDTLCVSCAVCAGRGFVEMDAVRT